MANCSVGGDYLNISSDQKSLCEFVDEYLEIINLLWMEVANTQEPAKKALLKEEIEDMKFAVAEMRKALPGFRGYAPSRRTLLHRPDLYLCDSKRGVAICT